MHREPPPESLGEPGEQTRTLEATPEVVVGEHDVDRAETHRLGDVRERHHAHVGRERQIRVAAHLGHARKARGGVLKVFEHVLQRVGDPQRGLDGPGAVRIDAQRVIGKLLAQRQDRRDLVVGREDPGLELERGEACLLYTSDAADE